MRRFGPHAVLLAALLSIPLTPAHGRFPDGFNHPEVRWMEFETDHFVMIFTPALESTAELGATILEGVHQELCDFLGARPTDKTALIFADFDDVGANNFTRRMEHVIYISNPIINQARIDRREWLTHLLVHEYTHVLNGWAFRQSAGVLGELAEWTGMELQPQWFSEGLCEYTASRYAKEPVPYVLQAAQQGELLYGAKMAIRDARFDIIETSTVYKQGQSMCQALARRYGEDVFRRILDQYGHTPQWDIAFKLATGDLLEAFYDAWLREVMEQAAQFDPDNLGAVAGVGLPAALEAALAARMSPDGQHIAVYGIADWEEPLPVLYLMNADGTGWRRIADNLDLYDSWKFTWSPDSRRLVYSGRVKAETGAIRNGLFVYDLQRERTHRLRTGEARVFEPEFSPDGSRLAVTTYANEHAVVATLAPDGSDLQLVTEGLGVSCFSPTWSPDGRRLAFSLADPAGVDIATINIDGSDVQRVTQDPWPDQYPAWSPDGRNIAFVSYRQEGPEPSERGDVAVAGEAEGLSGVRNNVYTVPATGGAPVAVTRLRAAGAYYPSWTPDGNRLLFGVFLVRRAFIRAVDVRAAESTVLGPLPSAGEPGLAAQAAPPVEVSPTQMAAEPPTAGAALARIDAEPAGPATPVAAAAAAPGQATAAPAQSGGRTPTRPYRSIERVRRYVIRPYSDDDALGDTIGVRARWSDPLLKHNFTAELEYGLGSDVLGYQVGYLNDQTAWRTGVNFFRRVPPLRFERGALVAEASTGFELLAELPLAITDDPYSQDYLRLGYEFANRDPFATSGGVLRPAPQSAQVAGPSVGFEHIQVLPGSGDQTVEFKLTRADDAIGSDLDFFSSDLIFTRRFYVPDPRHVFTLGTALQWFDGQDFSNAEVDRLLLSGIARYDWRVADEVLSRHTWPYLHIGPVYLTASYSLRELVAGAGNGVDLRDSLVLQMRNRGYLTRNIAYDLSVGPRFYLGSGGDVELLGQFAVRLRDLPF